MRRRRPLICAAALIICWAAAVSAEPPGRRRHFDVNANNQSDEEPLLGHLNDTASPSRRSRQFSNAENSAPSPDDGADQIRRPLSRSNSEPDLYRIFEEETAQTYAPPPFPINILVILPMFKSKNNEMGLTIGNCKPVIDIAVQDVVRMGLLPQGWANLTYWDDQLWADDTSVQAEKVSALGMIRAYTENRLDAILGFADDYALANIAKISPILSEGIPVITTIGMPTLLALKKNYNYLTRMSGSYLLLGSSMYHFFGKRARDEPKRPDTLEMSFRKMLFFYHDKKRGVNVPPKEGGLVEDEVPSSQCYFGMASIRKMFMFNSPDYAEDWKIYTPNFPFDEDILENPREQLKEWLKKESFNCQLSKSLIISNMLEIKATTFLQHFPLLPELLDPVAF
ncbi:unnamed protein product, partial [Mesorhabditis spiculigera]